ncbi:two-component sensor histidine kinase, partial [Variovorax sp. RHLX14]
MLRSLYSRHLYVRIWLAVVGGVVILTLMANWIVREAAEAERERLAPVPRNVVVLDAQDKP